MGMLHRIIHFLIIFSFALLFAVLSFLKVVHLCIKKGPKTMFTHKKRDEEPECLRDPVYGEHGYLHLEEVRIHYVSCGPHDKPLMLMLHGFPESWYSWRYQIKEFSKNFRVVAVDMRGYGDSDKPRGIDKYSMEPMVKDVKQIITALGYSSCILVGHDWGGAVTWAFSGCYPELVDKAIILNCPHIEGFRKYIRSHFAQFKKSWYMFFFLNPYLPEIFMGLADLKFFENIFIGKGGVHSGATTKEDVEVYKYLFQNFDSRTGPVNYIRAGLMCRTPSRLLQKVTKPILLIWGCRDLALETGNAIQCKEYAYDIRIKYIKESSHWVQMDLPEQVNSLIKEFLVEN